MKQDRSGELGKFLKAALCTFSIYIMAPRSKNFTISVAGRSSRCKAFNLNILKLTSTWSWPSLIKITENFVLFLLKEVKVSIIYNGKRVRKAALIIGFAKYSISQIISLSFSFFSLALSRFKCTDLQFLRSYLSFSFSAAWSWKVSNSSDHIWFGLWYGFARNSIPQITSLPFSFSAAWSHLICTGVDRGWR